MPTITYGSVTLDKLCDRVWMDPTTSDMRVRLMASLALSRATLAKNLGGTLQSAMPWVIACTTAPCGMYFVGGTQAVTLLAGQQPSQWFSIATTIVVQNLSTQANSDRVISHEMAHVELDARVSWNNSRLPAWFQEGFATYFEISDLCEKPMVKFTSDLNTLASQSVWNQYAQYSTWPSMYCQAAAEVGAWISKNGLSKLSLLLASVGSGAAFNTLYGPLLTQ